MRWVLIYAAGVVGLCALAFGCAEKESREHRTDEPAEQGAHPSQDDVAVLATAEFGPEEPFKLLGRVALVNGGKEPITIPGVPDIVIHARYVSRGGRVWECPSGDILQVVGQRTLRPGECALYRWDSSGLALQEISVLELTVIARWHGHSSGDHTTSSKFSFAAPVNRSRVPPGLPLWFD